MASNISPDLLRKRSHASIDINQLPIIEDNSEVESAPPEKTKESTISSKVNEYGSSSNIDSVLKLSPPVLNFGNLPTYLSSIVSSELGGTAKDELSSLVVMGCTFCRMYVMTSKADPKCPKCKNCMLMVPIKFQSEVGSTSLKKIKESTMNSKVNEYGSCSNIHSIPKLSPLVLNFGNLPAYQSSIVSSKVGDTAKDEQPPSVVMGCTFCLMYVLTSKADPKCPKCKNCMLMVPAEFQSEVGSTSLEKIKGSTMNSKVNEHDNCSNIDSIPKLSPPVLNFENLSAYLSSKVGSTSLEKIKGSTMSSKVNEYGNCSNIDSILKLSPPVLNFGNLPAYQSSIVSSKVAGTAKDERPTSVVMGCTFCGMYVMTSKADPKCPKCKNCMLMVPVEFQSKVGSASLEKVKGSTMNSKVNEHSNCSNIDSILKLSQPVLNFENLSAYLSSKVGSTSLEKIKGSTMSSKVNEYGSCSNIDSILKLSPPVLNFGNLPAYQSSIVSSKVADTAKDERPTSVVMRCTFCGMYVMTSKADPKCPKCKNCMLMVPVEFQSKVGSASLEKIKGIVNSKVNEHGNCSNIDSIPKLSPPVLNFENLSSYLSSKVGSTSLENIKGSTMSSKVNENGSCPNIDSILKLSPPILNFENLPSSELGGTPKDELPQLVVMGCTFCHMYVLASKVDPKCPTCKNHTLMTPEKFQLNNANRIGRIRK